MPGQPGRPVALLFPGQGAQYPRMAAGLYGHCAAFTAVMDRAFQLLGDDGPALRADWLADRPSARYDDVTRAQPLLYAVNCALGQQVLSWGVEPAALLGHSVGEMAAATLAGVFGFTSGMALMRDRMTAFAGTPPGGMLAVAASEQEVRPYLDGGPVAVAAVNAPRQLLLAGERDPVSAVQERLRADGITCRDVRARQAFHSPVVADAAERSAAAWRSVRLAPPRRTVYSGYLAGILPAATATDAAFWARQPAEPVLFGPALDRLLADGDYLLAEAGPGQSLTALARRHPAVQSGRSDTVALLPARPGGAEDDRRSVAAARERLAGEAAVPRGAAPRRGAARTASVPEHTGGNHAGH
jgi:acyl transferase domain-containing protein